MKEPPKLTTKPRQIVVSVLLTVIWLVFGLYAEFGVIPRPLVPITDAPGIAISAVGLGCGAAVFERYFPNRGRLILYPLFFLMVIWQGRAMTSAFPLGAMMASFFLTGVLLRVGTVEFDE